ncbi:hypothetical protein ADU86_13435, partial [Clostridium botulinum]
MLNIKHQEINQKKKELLKNLMGSASSKSIDLNKVRDEWRYGEIDNTDNEKTIISIDLEKVIKNKQILLGRDYGIKLRKLFNLDGVDRMAKRKENIKVMITIPDIVCSINSSFFRGMFKKSIKRFGENGFKNIYHFLCDEFQEAMIRDGISSTLM